MSTVLNTQGDLCRSLGSCYSSLLSGILLLSSLSYLACGILVPQPWIKPMPPTLEAQSLNHWTTWEVPGILSFKLYCFGKLLAPSPPFQIGRELTDSPNGLPEHFLLFQLDAKGVKNAFTRCLHFGMATTPLSMLLSKDCSNSGISVLILAPYSTHFLISIGLSHSAYAAWLYYTGFSREREPIN